MDIEMISKIVKNNDWGYNINTVAVTASKRPWIKWTIIMYGWEKRSDDRSRAIPHNKPK